MKAAKQGRRTPAADRRQPTGPLEQIRSDSVQRSRDDVEPEQRRDEPQRAARPDPERQPLAPECERAGIGGPSPIGGIVGERRHDRHHDERRPETQRAVAQEASPALVRQARPYEQPREQEHQRHEEGVVEEREQVEEDQAMAVHDRDAREPGMLRAAGRRGGADERVGEHRVMRHHKHRDERAQSVERSVAARRRVRIWSAGHSGEDRPCRLANAGAGSGIGSAFVGIHRTGGCFIHGLAFSGNVAYRTVRFEPLAQRRPVGKRLQQLRRLD
jgi:hypothetical protein